MKRIATYSKTDSRMKYSTIKGLKKAIDRYFAPRIKKDSKTGLEIYLEPLSITALALDMGISRATLINYEKNDTLYANAIREAKQKIEAYSEKQLYLMRNPAGAIFALTNNNKLWSSKFNLDHTTEGKALVIPQIYASKLADKKDAKKPL